MVASPSRRRARRDALFVLYQHEIRGESVERLLDELRAREGYAPDDFTVACVHGVVAEAARYDAAIARHSRDWPVERLAPLERGVLRLAVHEILSGLTPPEVAVNEAVRLAKTYATDAAGSLVNGILGALLRELAAADGDVRGAGAGGR